MIPYRLNDLVAIPISHRRAVAAVFAVYLFCGRRMNQSGIYYEWNGAPAAFSVPPPKPPTPSKGTKICCSVVVRRSSSCRDMECGG